MDDSLIPLWQPSTRPDWLTRFNREGDCFDLSAVVPLDQQSLIDHARKATGMQDFGDDLWREPFSVLCQSLEEEAGLHMMGRLMARNDIILWLSARLRVVDILRQHPEIQDEDVVAPMVIVGLPRSGTSILFELLARDPDVGVPQTWEAMMPCPPPERETYLSDSRIKQAHDIATQWNRVAPEFATMHEMGGRIPAECGQIMTGTFISDHIAALHQTPSYSAWCAQADYLPVYQYHKKILQILQWKNPRKRWLLKAPEHQVHLATLLQVYPDARIVQTHRDPLKCMASTASLMGTLYHMRSDLAFNAEMFENIIMGEATAQRLENVMDQREQGVVPATNIADCRYQDLMNDPLACIEKLYRYFHLSLSDVARSQMEAYLESKPKDKSGVHGYQVAASRMKERPLFARYQSLYNVPDEI